MAKTYNQDDISVFNTVSESEQSKKHVDGNEITLGHFSGFDDAGEPMVRFSGRSLTAITTVALTHAHIGRQVALMFVGQDLSKPVLIGLVRNQLDSIIECMSNSPAVAQGQEDHGVEVQGETVESSDYEVTSDGKKLTIEAEDEILLKCGESSISLNKSGKVVIRGKYVLSRSRGVNRIMGGSVQVN